MSPTNLFSSLVSRSHLNPSASQSKGWLYGFCPLDEVRRDSFALSRQPADQMAG